MCVVDAQSFCPSSFTVVCMLLLGVVLFALRFGLDLSTFVGVCTHTLVVWPRYVRLGCGRVCFVGGG